MSILVPTDFASGRWKTPLDPNQQANDMPDYINRIEAEYLPQLFGVELYDLFIADLALPTAGEPTDPRFEFVYNPFNYQDSSDFLQSKGIKDMLKGFVYYEYIRDILTAVTPNGTIETIGENSVNVSGIKHDITSRYNESIEIYKTIQTYMFVEKPEDYPEFDGIFLRFNHTF